MSSCIRPLWLCISLLAVLVVGSDRVEARDADLAVAQKARESVVRIRWRDARFSRRQVVRNAVVIRADGMLLMAGAPFAGPGSLTAVLSDGRELPAELLAADTQTALTLLRVRAAHLRPLVLRTEPEPKAAAKLVPKAAPKADAWDAPKAAGKPDATKNGAAKGAAKGAGTAPEPARPTLVAPLSYPPLGLPVVMVTSDGSVALGAVRAQRRQGTLVDPATRQALLTTGLIGAALAVVDEDVGAPFLDEDGQLVGLMVGRKSVVAPERGEEAAGVGLRLRPTPREAVAVPASVIRLVWPLLERFRRVPRAALGVRTLAMDDVLRAQLDLDTGGHVVQTVTPGGPAARAGLELHDVIVGIDGRPVEPGASLHDCLLPYRPGAAVKLDIYRAGERVSAELRLQELR
jgi:S1-C subfamily serine protease